MSALRERWHSGADAFWARADKAIFGWGSPATMGVYRILMGCVMFINAAMVGLFFEDWFTEVGFVPARSGQIWNGTEPRFNPLGNVTETWITASVYILWMVFALTTALGLKTRFSTIMLFLITVALDHRNAIILHGGDTLMRVACFSLAVMPCGEMYSLDRLLRIKKGDRTVREVSLWPQRLAQFEVSLMYLTTFIIKMTGQRWPDGTASWYPKRLNEFDKFPTPPFAESLPAVYFQTYFTLFIWLAMGTLVFWRPARKWVLLGAVLIHMGIEWEFNIPLFAFVCIAQYVTHYEGNEVEAWVERMKARFRKGEPVPASAIVEPADATQNLVS